MTDTTFPEALEGKSPRSYGFLSLTIAAAFGLFFAYDLWEAVSTLIALPQFYSAFGLDASYIPWWLLWLGVLIPPVLYGLALLIGRKQGVLARTLILLVGLALSAALSLSAIALEQVLRPELIAVIG